MSDEEELTNFATQPHHHPTEAHHPVDTSQSQLHQTMTDNAMVHGAGGGC